MGIISFNQRKNKRFNYKPRFDKNEVINDSVSKSDDLIFKWKKKSHSLKRSKNKSVSLSILILILIGIIIAMYYLENNY